MKNAVENTIETLKMIQCTWADQVADEGQEVSDYDAIDQVVKCLEEWLEIKTTELH